MKKIAVFILMIFVGFASIITTGCKNDNVIRINEVTHSIFYAPLYVAINNGYFEEYLFEQGFFDCRRGESFASRKARSRVNGFYYYNNDDTWRKKQ